MSKTAVIIDVATRFLRTNPELLEVAQHGAGESGRPVEALLGDAVLRIRRSGFEPIATRQLTDPRGPGRRISNAGSATVSALRLS